MLDTLYPPQRSRVIVDIAPVYNALGSLVSIADARQSPGISDWSLRTRDALSQEAWEQHRIIAHWIGIEALSNVVDTPEALASFPTFVQALSSQEPTALRDDLLYWIVACPSSRLTYKPAHPQVDDPLSLLASEEAFFAFYDLEGKSEGEAAILRQVRGYLLDPPALQALITAYLARFWQEHLREEWERALPHLEKAVVAFEGIDTTGMSHFEIIEAVTRRNLRGVYRAEMLVEYATLRFIPSLHCGPYILRFSDGRELRIVFGAHHLLDRARGSEVLDRARLLDCMRALADETRLEIIRLLKMRGELGTHEIIDELDLSRSAASRHLRQLYASGIIDVRVAQDGIRKHYQLDPGFRQEIGNLLGRLL